jgi:hypothetical protein
MSDKETIEDYAYLLNDTSGRYVLVQAGPDESRELCTCLVYDTNTNTALLIEDDELSLEVKTALQKSGVPMLPNVP